MTANEVKTTCKTTLKIVRYPKLHMSIYTSKYWFLKKPHLGC